MSQRALLANHRILSSKTVFALTACLSYHGDLICKYFSPCFIYTRLFTTYLVHKHFNFLKSPFCNMMPLSHILLAVSIVILHQRVFITVECVNNELFSTLLNEEVEMQFKKFIPAIGNNSEAATTFACLTWCLGDFIASWQ